MTTILKNTLRFLGIPASMLAVWLVFLGVFWASHGAAAGAPAFVAALLAALALWWRAARRGARRHAVLLGAALVLALVPLAYVLVPLTPAALVKLPANLEV